MSLSEAQIRQLEKRARGFRRLIAALNDLNAMLQPTEQQLRRQKMIEQGPL